MKPTISMEQWQNALSALQYAQSGAPLSHSLPSQRTSPRGSHTLFEPNKYQINELVRNYLAIGGHHEALRTFEREAGLSTNTNGAREGSAPQETNGNDSMASATQQHQHASSNQQHTHQQGNSTNTNHASTEHNHNSTQHNPSAHDHAESHHSTQNQYHSSQSHDQHSSSQSQNAHSLNQHSDQQAPSHTLPQSSSHNASSFDDDPMDTDEDFTPPYPQYDSALLEQRHHVRQLIQSGKIEEAVDYVHKLCPTLLSPAAHSDDHSDHLSSTSKHISFHLNRQHMIEMIRQGRVQDVLSFAREQMQHEVDQCYQKDIEDTMTLLAFADDKNSPVSQLLSTEKREETAALVNKALLEANHQVSEPELPKLLRLLKWGQHQLAQKVNFPMMRDFESGVLCDTEESSDSDSD